MGEGLSGVGAGRAWGRSSPKLVSYPSVLAPSLPHWEALSQQGAARPACLKLFAPHHFLLFLIPFGSSWPDLDLALDLLPGHLGLIRIFNFT